jgi:hypothetical protein
VISAVAAVVIAVVLARHRGVRLRGFLRPAALARATS